MLKESTQKRLLLLSGLDKYEKEILKESNLDQLNNVKQFLVQKIELGRKMIRTDGNRFRKIWNHIVTELSEMLSDIEYDLTNVNENIATNVFNLTNVIEKHGDLSPQLQKLKNELLTLYANLTYSHNPQTDKKGYQLDDKGDTYSEF